MTHVPALQLESVSIDYGRRRVVDEVAFDVRRGEVFGFLGLNGAGKTTLLKGLLDIVRLAAGEVRILGVPHGDPEARRQLAFLPERFNPPTNLTGAEWLRAAVRPYDVWPDTGDMAAAVSQLALPEDALRARIGTYSKGMGQKLGLAGAFMTGRPLIVLDEPMSGLDPLARLRLKSRVAAHRAEGGTLLMSSHVLADVEEMCDRIAVLHESRLVYSGTPAELCAGQGTESLERAMLRLLGLETAAL